VPRLQRRRQHLLDPMARRQHYDGEARGQKAGAPVSRPAGHSQASHDPDRGSGGEPLHPLVLAVPQDDAASQEADACDDALQDPGAGAGVGRGQLQADDGHERSAERDQGMRPEASRFLPQAPVEAD
jgi:hypothetical protein